MCFHPYVLERITASRLEELRAEAARRVALGSMKRDRPGVAEAARAAVARVGRFLGFRRTVRPRPA